jgi:para-nitrobenzyl esterase
MTVVETRYGKVEGIERDGVLQFRGLPFAASPVGDLRWQAPRAPEPWTGVRAAQAFAPMAPQGESPIPLFPQPEVREVDEDGCLALNVYTPSVDGDPRPVMVWIHGGGFTAGSAWSPWYNGSSFARNGVVVVTIQYRLGALGFLHLGDRLPGAPNRGLLDQVAALEWVRDNIAAFGGDPGNVTVFGESAGGMSVGCLLAMPSASGLFHKAIAQSGAASTVNDPARAGEVTDALLSRLGGVDALRTAPWKRILEAQFEVMGEFQRGGGGLAFMPLVDGAVLPRVPLETIAAGAAAPVKLLTGTNRDEMTLFLLAEQGVELDEETVVRRLDRTGPGGGRARYDAYRAELGDGATPRGVWVAVETDRVFRIPAVRMASAQSRHTADVWMYLFTWESPALDGAVGSTHALEIPFVWNALSPAAEGFTGSGPEAQALADEMHAAWIAFATSGDPGWQRYDEGRRATRVFGPGAGTVDDPMGAARARWDPVPA